jgi:CO/xanthine dehydrogenase Mo-binding subunit
VADLVVSEGEVRRRNGGRVATFGELVDFVGELSTMPPPPLKKPSEFKHLGKPLPRLDIPAKVMGAATFGIDVRQPGLLYAAVQNAPTFGGSAAGFKLKGALPRGVETVIIVPGGIAAIGSSWWRANKLLKEGIEVQWQPGPEPTLNSAGLWKRYEELMATAEPALIRHDCYRPMALARWRAELDTTGTTPKLAGVSKRQVAQSPSDQFPARLGLPPEGKPEGNAVENPPYAFPFYRLDSVVADGSVPVGFWRSVGHSHTAFFDESFVDELVFALKTDPFEFRLELLGGRPRHLKVLETAAREAGWGRPLSAGSGRGIALRASFGSIVAQVAEVAVADGKTLQVKRVTCAIDCGPMVNPAIVRMQMESGIVYGLSAALYGEITLANGAVEQANFPDYDALRLAEAPVMSVHFVDNGSSFIGGVGEPGTPPIAPAVANAVFAATGQRLRNPPLRLT